MDVDPVPGCDSGEDCRPGNEVVPGSKGGERMFTAHEVFDLAVQIEENGERFYRDGMEKVDDSAVRSLLEKLADEEVRHRETFYRMKRELGRQDEDLWADRISGAVLQSFIEDRAFSLEEADFASVRDEGTLLQIAVGFEKDSITFYEILLSFSPSAETAELIRAVIAEEHRHIGLLEEMAGELAAKPLTDK